MKNGSIYIFCGEGKGKTTAAIGKAVQAACAGRTVMIIQFLKERQSDEIGFVQKMEPEIKLFRFERSAGSYESLSDGQRKEECINIRNGLNFARKVISTQGCDMLVLDEVLGLLENHIVDAEEIRSLLALKDGNMDLILTGMYRGEELWDLADEVTVMQMAK